MKIISEVIKLLSQN